MTDAVGPCFHPDPPEGFKVFKHNDYLRDLYKRFWGQPEKIDAVQPRNSILFDSSMLTMGPQLYVFDQYVYLRHRIDAVRQRNTSRKRSVIITGTPGIGKAFYLLSPSDITSR